MKQKILLIIMVTIFLIALSGLVSAVDMPEDYVLFLKLTENINDSSGNNNPIHSSIDWIEDCDAPNGQTGCYNFTGGESRLVLADSDDFYLKDNFTIAFWVNFYKHTSPPSNMFFHSRSVSTTRFECSWNAGDFWHFDSEDDTIYVTDPAPPSTAATNTWEHLAIIMNGGNITLYRNGTAVNSVITGGSVKNVPSNLTIGNAGHTLAVGYTGYMINFVIYNYSVSEEELTAIKEFSDVDLTPPAITIGYPSNGSIYNNYNGSFSVVLAEDGGNVSLNDSRWVYSYGTATTFNFINNTPIGQGDYVINVSGWDVFGNNASTLIYFTIDLTAPSITSNIENNDTTWGLSLDLNITFEDGIGLDYIIINDSCGFGIINTSIPNPFNFYRNINLANCSLGQQHTNITAVDTAGNNQTVTYLWESMATLNITATSVITGSPITIFSIYNNGTLAGSTTDGYYVISNLTIGNHNITIDAQGYELKSALVSVTNKNQSYSFSLYTRNSLEIIIRDEDTNDLILQNITIKFSSVDQEWKNTTNTSNFYIDELNVTEYILLFSSSGYGDRTYTVTIGNGTYQNLWVYLSQNTSTTLFSVTDQDTTETLDTVLFSMYRFINGSWATIESKYTDITGQAQFTYIVGENYKFFLSKTGYEDYVFYLTPIIFSTYDVKISKSTLINYSQDFDGLSVIYSPQIFPNNASRMFNFIISSPNGFLIQYRIDLTYPGGTSSAVGTNAIGSQLSALVNISGASVFDTVTLDYYYITTTAGRRNFTMTFPITFVDGPGSNLTMAAKKDRTYGLGIFERLLILTIIVIFVVGIATMVGQPIPGLAMGLFVFGYGVSIGFIGLWGILPSMFVGFMFLMWKSGGM